MAPAPYATDSAVWAFRLGAQAMISATSSGLNTTGRRSGSRTGLIRLSTSGSPTVVRKKNFKPVSVRFTLMFETP
jgi:hypothetical protein